MKILILDDDDKRHRLFSRSAAFADHELKHATTFMQAKNELLFSKEPYDLVMLDYDLNDHQYSSMKDQSERYTGFDLAKVIVEEVPDDRKPMVIVHSWNWDGAKNMTVYLEDNKVWVRQWIFHNEMKNIPLPAGPRRR